MVCIYSVEGNIGSGKSTLVKYMREQYTRDFEGKKVIFVDEPVDEWSKIKDGSGETMLEKFYKDQNKYAFPFQMMAYISRLSMLKKVKASAPDDAIIITERSVYTDKYVFAKMLHDSGQIEEVNYQVYLKWFEEFVSDIPISGIIYIRTEPEVAHERIGIRARKGEDIPLHYIKRCHKNHEDWLYANYSPEQMLVLNGNLELKTESDYWSWFDCIELQFKKTCM